MILKVAPQPCTMAMTWNYKINRDRRFQLSSIGFLDPYTNDNFTKNRSRPKSRGVATPLPLIANVGQNSLVVTGGLKLNYRKACQEDLEENI